VERSHDLCEGAAGRARFPEILTQRSALPRKSILLVDSRALWVKRRLGVIALVAIFVQALSAELGSPVRAAPQAAQAASAQASAGREAGTKPAAAGVVRADPERWRIIDSQSGPVNYYTIQRDAERTFLRGSYQPPNKKAVLGFELPV
jgi:hypothetical protein